MGVAKETFGGSKGYRGGTVSWSLKLPLAYGVSSAPSITAADDDRSVSSSSSSGRLGPSGLTRTGLKLVAVLLPGPSADARGRLLVEHLQLLLEPQRGDARRALHDILIGVRARGDHDRKKSAPICSILYWPGSVK
jgi:hypothetical protein